MKLVLIIKNYFGYTVYLKVLKNKDPSDLMFNAILPTDLLQGHYSYKIMQNDKILMQGTYNII